MLARADSLKTAGRLNISAGVSPAAFPAWARPAQMPENEAEAAFCAGAALARVDAILRENPPCAGVLRQRLALAAAVSSVARSGRAEGEAALRDALHLTRPGADPGPAARKLLAWRALTAGSTGQWRSTIAVAAGALGVFRDEGFHAAVEAAKTCAGGTQCAPLAAATAFGFARRALNRGAGPKLGGRGGEAELLATWLADAVLAQKLNFSFALPLLATGLISTGGKRAAGELSEGDETTRILSAYAKAAAQACDLAAELGRRTRKLQDAAPKLRAKGAGSALQALLDDDCLSAATRVQGLSERGARRLFERLVALGAIRELTGRKTFRLYGL